MAPAAASYATMISMVGAVVGAVIFGQLSESIGRRWSMIAALALSLTVIPLWAFSGAFATLALGAFLMQAGVQGAWGIIPAHLNELAPDSARGLLPGLAYQLGILVAAPTNTIEYALRDHIGYARAMAAFEVLTMLVGAVVIAMGSEKHGKEFLRAPTVGA
jgi:SHS family lactate transporter-like MFS transporter